MYIFLFLEINIKFIETIFQFNHKLNSSSIAIQKKYEKNLFEAIFLYTFNCILT